MPKSKNSALLLLVVIAVLSFLAGSFSGPQRVAAQADDAQVGRYQISAWSAYSGAYIHHSGYYVLDTTTGRVVDRGHEVRSIDEGDQDSQ